MTFLGVGLYWNFAVFYLDPSTLTKGLLLFMHCYQIIVAVQGYVWRNSYAIISLSKFSVILEFGALGTYLLGMSKVYYLNQVALKKND